MPRWNAPARNRIDDSWPVGRRPAGEYGHRRRSVYGCCFHALPAAVFRFSVPFSSLADGGRGRAVAGAAVAAGVMVSGVPVSGVPVSGVPGRRGRDLVTG
ncbi:hypothetical protein Francci3_1499 [Frankia casuarinae]|uniref:Uncharacterized protein n=1 Tax=Frankia casuarinae (strain DSM 45818 / CECT 9043 / HFP020203 / CcI3) TaxID=106370 RepID=Q2JCW7_FRACC|nr:hypothetical protein Francci3_1499 [Frankia casuarinae]